METWVQKSKQNRSFHEKERTANSPLSFDINEAVKDMYTIQIQLEATSKDLNFLSDPELAQIIKTILMEIDSLAIIRAHRSLIYLSMSTLEGILSNVLALNINKIKTFPSYPKKKGGSPKDINDLKLAHKIAIAKDLQIIESDFFDTFKKFKEFRNYMHPLIELEDKHPLDIGLGQIALGLMNHTISKLEKIRFIEEKIWKVVSGVPVYNSSQQQIEFKLFRPLRTHSFLVTEDYAGNDVKVNFDLHIGEDAVFNFIFNYENEERFHMLRFETRKNEFSGVLHCDHKYAWHLIEEYNSKWNINTAEPNKVLIHIDSANLKLYLNGNEELSNKSIPCDNKKYIGFFNEVKNVSITNLSITAI